MWIFNMLGECFEILNILVEVLVLGKGQGSMGLHIIILKTPQSFFRWLVWHIKKQALLYVIFLPELLSASSSLILTIYLTISVGH